MFIDSHTHLSDSKFDTDRQEVIERAIAEGVTRFILPATGVEENEVLFDLATKYPGVCFPTIGLHPMEFNDNPDYREHLSKIEEQLENPPLKFVAIGEIGLDLYWEQKYLEQQIEGLRFQLDLAVKYNLPVIIHSRDAWSEILPILADYSGRIRGVFHSFAGTKAQIEKIEEIGGFYYGINGTVTYKNSVLPEALKSIPLEKILLETDSPYLPPTPYRGKRNESSYIPIIAAFVAQLKGVRTEELAERATKNTEELFLL